MMLIKLREIQLLNVNVLEGIFENILSLLSKDIMRIKRRNSPVWLRILNTTCSFIEKEIFIWLALIVNQCTWVLSYGWWILFNSRGTIVIISKANVVNVVVCLLIKVVWDFCGCLWDHSKGVVCRHASLTIRTTFYMFTAFTHQFILNKFVSIYDHRSLILLEWICIIN